jgi:hypothetical protein
LRTIGGDANCNSDCNSYPKRDTHRYSHGNGDAHINTYAWNNTFTEDSADPEDSTDASATPLARPMLSPESL